MAGLITDPGPDKRIKLRLAPRVNRQGLLAASGVSWRVGRNTFRTNGIGDVDLGVTKVLNFNERHSVLLRAEIFNLFNRPHFAIPERIPESQAFGASTQTTIPARMVQFMPKYNF